MILTCFEISIGIFVDLINKQINNSILNLKIQEIHKKVLAAKSQLPVPLGTDNRPFLFDQKF